MDEARFDRLAAALAAASSRRGLLLPFSAGILAALGRADQVAEARKKKKKKCKGNTKKCGSTCIPKANCCTSRECPEGEVCRNGRCSDCATADDCPPSDTACQGPVCENGRCATAQLPAGSNCFTGRFCVGNETCDANGVCQGGALRDCDDGIACIIDSCDESINQCVHAENDNVCDTGDVCRIGRCDPTDGDSDQDGCVFDTPSQTVCQPASCVGTTLQPAAKCDGNGNCVAPPTQSCEPYLCNGNGVTCSGACGGDDCFSGYFCEGGQCKPLRQNGEACTFSSNCAPGLFCDNGTCRPKLANGETCANESQCASGICVANVCCATSCTAGQSCFGGTCQG